MQSSINSSDDSTKQAGHPPKPTRRHLGRISPRSNLIVSRSSWFLRMLRLSHASGGSVLAVLWPRSPAVGLRAYVDRGESFLLEIGRFAVQDNPYEDVAEGFYILNTNFSNNPTDHEDMLQNKRQQPILPVEVQNRAPLQG